MSSPLHCSKESHIYVLQSLALSGRTVSTMVSRYVLHLFLSVKSEWQVQSDHINSVLSDSCSNFKQMHHYMLCALEGGKQRDLLRAYSGIRYKTEKLCPPIV